MHKIWNLSDVEGVLAETGDKAGLATKGIPVSISDRMEKTMGSFVFKEKDGKIKAHEFKFSARLLSGEFDEEIVKNVIIHEYAHFYANVTIGKNNGHNAVFKNVCRSLGIPDDTLFTAPGTRVIRKKGYKLVCSSCGETVAVRRHRDAAVDIVKYKISGCCEAKIKAMTGYF